jgi:hypothetical protein
MTTRPKRPRGRPPGGLAAADDAELPPPPLPVIVANHEQMVGARTARVACGYGAFHPADVILGDPRPNGPAADDFTGAGTERVGRTGRGPADHSAPNWDSPLDPL